MTLSALRTKLRVLTGTSIGEVLFGWKELLSANRNKTYPIIFWSLAGSKFQKDARSTTIQKTKELTVTVFAIINFDPSSQDEIDVWDTLEGYFDVYINKMDVTAGIQILNIDSIKGEYVPEGLIPSIDSGAEIGIMYQDVIIKMWC